MVSPDLFAIIIITIHACPHYSFLLTFLHPRHRVLAVSAAQGKMRQQAPV